MSITDLIMFLSGLRCVEAMEKPKLGLQVYNEDQIHKVGLTNEVCRLQKKGNDMYFVIFFASLTL